MTYPVDDKGNVRVDFVWGPMPMQPDQQRVNTGGENENITTDGNWTVYKEVGSSNLDSGWEVLTFSTGDGGGSRQQTFEYDSHNIATTGYSNYPAYKPNYAGDGDIDIETFVTMPNLAGLTTSAANAIISGLGFPTNVQIVNTTRVGATTVNDGKIQSQEPLAGVETKNNINVNVQTYNAPEVPNVVGLTETAAGIALVTAGLVKGTVTTADNAAGATAENDGLVKTQSVAAGTTVNTGSTVTLVKYAYVALSTTGPIAGISRGSGTSFSLNGNQAIMYVVGRTVKPAVGNTIQVSGTNNETHNVGWTVEAVENNDSYNTGGTAVKITLVTGAFTGDTSTGGTWALV